MNDNLEECPRCQGTGEVEACYSDNGGWEYNMCHVCNGRGYVDNQPTETSDTFVSQIVGRYKALCLYDIDAVVSETVECLFSVPVGDNQELNLAISDGQLLLTDKPNVMADSLWLRTSDMPIVVKALRELADKVDGGVFPLNKYNHLTHFDQGFLMRVAGEVGVDYDLVDSILYEAIKAV